MMKLRVPESATIRAELAKVNPGSKRYEELMQQLEQVYRAAETKG